METGQDKPGRKTLFKLASFYEVTVEWLADGLETVRGEYVDDPAELAWIHLWRTMAAKDRRHLSAMLARFRAA